MDLTAEGLLGFVSANRAWAAPVAFVLAAADTTAILSLLLPATPLLIAMGALVAAESLDFFAVWAGAAAGAVAGSTLSWWIGHHFGRAVLGHAPFDSHPATMRRALAALARWGPPAVLVAHIFPPLTSAMFLIAGIVRVPFARFQAFNLPGAAIWAWFLPVTGELGTFLIGRIWDYVQG